MAAKSKSGSNVITGGSGSEHLNGGAGPDIISGMGGNDRINGGAGDDRLDGGAGNDIVSGDAGNDTAVYRVGENAGSTDVYDGGSGIDTLQLEMTRAEWQSPAVQADIARYLAFLAEVIHPVNGQAKNVDFTFSFGLVASKFENLLIMVDGVEMDPRDEAVTLVDDVMAAGEDTASVAVDVFINDSVPDLIASLTNTQPSHGSVTLTRTSGAPATADTARFIYTPDPTHWQYLAAGETATDTFTYTVTDADGDVQTATVTVTITGSNDAPTLTAAVSDGAVVEDGAVTASGTIAFADADLSDSHSVASSADGSGYLGAFTATVTDNGAGDGAGSVAWDFSVDNAAIQYLAEGETLTQTYTVTIDDGQGGTVDQTVTVTLTGTNDAPVITAANGQGSVSETEVAGVPASATPVMLDVEANDAFATAQLIDRADLRVADNANLGDDADPSIEIQGSIATRDDQDVYHIDLRAGETLTLDVDFAGIVPGAGGLDSFVFLYDAAGNLLNFNDDSSTAAGGGGSTYTQDSFLQFVASLDGTFYIVVKDFDQFGQSSAGTYSLNVSVDSQNLQLTDTGSMSFSDVDLADGHTVDVAAQDAGHLGTLTAVVADDSTNDGTGTVNWTFSVANAAVQFLAAGETRTQTYTVTVDDGQGGTASETVAVTITGENDGPVISTAFSAGQITENGAPSIDGVIAFDDVDLIDSHTVSAEAETAGYLGTFAVVVNDSATGEGAGEVTWTFSATDAELAYLAEGQSLLQRYIVTLDDGAGGTTQQLVNITIVGTNDAPTITSAVSSAAVQEDGAVAASGAIAFADVDLRDGHTVSSAAGGVGYLGTFTASVSDDGAGDGAGSVTWDFAVDNAAIQYLAEGETLTQTYTVTINDGRGGTVQQPVTITITGTNDAPVVQNVSAAATEDGAPVTVAFSADDVDNDDDAGTLTYAITSVPAEGSVVNNGDGTFAFNPGADFQDLAEGETREIIFGYDATDSHGATTPGSVTITVTGTNDAPVTGDVELGGSAVGAGFPLVFGGYYNYYAYNQDSGEVIFSLIDTNGDGVVDAPGSSSELPDDGQAYSDVHYGLAVGDVDGDGDVDVVVATQQGLISYTNVGDADGDGVANFTRTVIASGFRGYDVALADLNNDGRLDVVASQYNVMSELLNIGDANGDGLVNDFAVRTVQTGAQGSGYGVTAADMNGDGLTDIVIANYYNGPNQIALNLGDTNGDGQIDYRIQNLTGAYNQFGLGVATGDVDGDGDLDLLISRWNGQNELIYINDGDTNGDGLINFRTIELPTGGNTLESELIDIDGDGDLDVVTAELSGNARIAYNEGDSNGDGLVEFSLQSVTGASGNYGVAVGDVDGDGDLDIVFPSTTANGAVYLQNQGDTDGDGQINFARVALTGVDGSWDAQFTNIGGGGGSGAYEDGPVVTGSFDGDDVDSDDDGASLTYTITSAPSEGSVVNNGDGTFGFSPGDDFQDLAQGETRTVTFTYTATDAHGAVSEPSTVTIRVAGTNDAPVAAVDSVAGTEDASVTINVLANDTDVDGETLTVTHVNGANIAVNGTVALGGGASVRLNADGTLTYSPAANATGVQSFSYTVSDGLGGTATSTVEVDLAAVNDAPVSQSDTASTDEDTALVLTASSLLANDADLDGDTLSISSVSAVSERGASVSINAAGDVVYNPGDSAELQALSRGQQAIDTFTYVVTDPSGATSTATVTVTVQGQLEAPVANPDTVTVSQNGQSAGNVVANDTVTGSTDNSGNVLVNGSFEDGHGVGPGGIDYPASLPGWTSVQGSFEVWGTGFGGNVASDGIAFLELDNGAGQDAYSSNLTTDVGREYTLNFDLAQRSGTSPATNQVEFLVNGVSLGVFTPPTTTFSTFTVTFIGTGADVITFREPASANEGVGGLIDNLRISADADVFVTAVDGDAGLVGQEVEGSNGGEFILQSDGSYAFDTDGDFVHLVAGESATTSVTYTVTDDGGSSTTTLTVTVEGENDGPVANNDTVAAVEDQAVTFDVRANDSDVDGDSLTVTHIEGQAISGGGAVALTDGGFVTLNADGTLTYTPVANASGQINFTYTVADGNGGVATAATTINVASTNDAPVAEVDAVRAAEGAAVTIDVLANDSDVDGDALAVTHVNGSSIAVNGTVTLESGASVLLNNDGTLTYTPVPGTAGAQSFTYTITDGSGGSTTGTVEISPAPRVLFIDDDYGLGGETTWLATLDELGYEADYVSISQYGNVTTDLSQYDVVIWSVGDRAYDNLTAANIATLEAYLDGGGSVLYAGGHSVYQEFAAASFIQNYLGVGDYLYNMPMFSNGSQPIVATDGEDNVSLRVWAGGQYDNMLSAFNVTAPTARALLELVPGNYSSGGGQGANDIVSINDTGVFRAALWGFDLNHLDASNRAEVLLATLEALTAPAGSSGQATEGCSLVTSDFGDEAFVLNSNLAENLAIVAFTGDGEAADEPTFDVFAAQTDGTDLGQPEGAWLTGFGDATINDLAPIEQGGGYASDWAFA